MTSEEIKKELSRIESAGTYDAKVINELFSLVRRAANSLGRAELRIEEFDCSDHVRILRVIEYTGTRIETEQAVRAALHGEREINNGKVTIKAATVGIFPDILEELDGLEEGK